MESKRFSLLCSSLDGSESYWHFKFDSLFLSQKSLILLITERIANKQRFFHRTGKVRGKKRL